MTEPREPFEEWLAAEPVHPLAPRPGDFERVARGARRRRLAGATGLAAAVLVLLTAVTGVVASLTGSDGGVDTPATPLEPSTSG